MLRNILMWDFLWVVRTILCLVLIRMVKGVILFEELLIDEVALLDGYVVGLMIGNPVNFGKHEFMFWIFVDMFSLSLSVAYLMKLFLHNIVLICLVVQDLDLVFDDWVLDGRLLRFLFWFLGDLTLSAGVVELGKLWFLGDAFVFVQIKFEFAVFVSRCLHWLF